jgi:hypothetical protein
MSELKLISLSLTAEFMSIDSEMIYLKIFPNHFYQKLKEDSTIEE